MNALIKFTFMHFFHKWLGVILFIAVITAGWSIRSFYDSSNKTTNFISQDFRFVDFTDSVGIQFNYEDPIADPIFKGKERIFFVGGGVSVADVNGDGWMDIFLVTAKNGSKNHLYINEEGKRFREAAEEWGVADTNHGGASMAPVFFDYDNDGKPDLYITGLGCSKLFKNMGDRFENVSQTSGLCDCKNGVSALPLDYDNDGFIDLYVLRYWGPHNFFHLANPNVWFENFFDAKNGGANSLYRNRGDGTFEDVTETAGGADSHWSFDATLADFDGDGILEILVANDIGPDTLFSIRNAKLVDESYRLGLPDRRSGMSASLGDLDGDGMPNVYVSNIWERQYIQEGNFLRKFGKDGFAEDEAIARKVDICGWAWGSAFADFNLDGLQDLYVANGMISGRSKNRYYSFGAGTLMAEPVLFAKDVRNWPPVGNLSWSGHQVDCIFLNQGGHFEDVAPFLGPNIPWDGRAVALIDFDNNGSEDLIVTTQNESAHLLKNEISPQNKWISLHLVGTKSNRDGVGARVAVKQGEKIWYRWSTGRTGLWATSDPRLHFGIPKGVAVDVEIRWPSGIVQNLQNLAVGKYYEVVENETP